MYLALVGKSEAVATPFPLPRGGGNSPHLPVCSFRASGGSARSTPRGELFILIYAV